MRLNIDTYYRLARLDKPIGIWLLFLPCCFGIALSNNSAYWLYPLFAAGAIIMRSAGCIINDIFDRKLDAKVERTKNRPLASGEISLFHALVVLGILLLMGMCILYTLPPVSIYIGLGIMPFVIAYPLMKRFTYYPQFVLGLVFNIGVLIAYSTATGTISLSAFFCYIGCICWTLGYDTIYAVQDMEDDKQVGIKSTAIKFGSNLKKYIGGLYLVFVLFMLALNSFHWFSLICWGLATAHLAWQSYKTSTDKPILCGQLFKSNVYVGILIWLSLM
jgi:4-hydroxybenzoate polyprenyltransferase